MNDQRQMVSDALSNPDALPLRPVPGKQQLDFWSVREQVVRTGCGILSALALLLLLIAGRNLRRRWEAPELWAQVEYLGLVLFGLFWWFALRFGAIGLLLSVGAVALQVAAWLRKPPAAIPSPQ